MASERKYNILVVDDNEANRLTAQTILAPLGENVVPVASGRDALRALLRQEFAVVLMDVNMPGMGGLETAAAIRQNERFAHLPIIFVTATDYAGQHMAEGYALGAVDYVFTPVPLDVLRAKVQALLTLRRHAERVLELEQREHRRALAASQERLETEEKRNRFFTLAVDLLAIAGTDGYLRHLNPSWEAALGFSKRELLARPLIEFVGAEYRPLFAEALERLAAGGTVRDLEARFGVKGGGDRWLVCNASPFPDENLIYLAAHDITERRRAEQERAAHEALLLQVNQELESFSYSVSHDLRAPLRAIEGFSQILEQEYATRLDEPGRQHLQQIRKGVERMGGLIEDLLRLSRVTRCEMQWAQVALSSMAAEIAAELEQRTPERKVEMAIQPGVAAVGDQRLLQIAMQNLLENAWKFTSKTEAGRIEVGAREEDGQRVYFVRDNGAGFDGEHSGRLFGAFQRLHRAQDFPGTGIGLALVKRIVTRHRGRVWAEGAPGRGATISFTLGREEVP